MGNRHFTKCLGRLGDCQVEFVKTPVTWTFCCRQVHQTLDSAINRLDSGLSLSSLVTNPTYLSGIHDLERKIFEARGAGPDGKEPDIGHSLHDSSENRAWRLRNKSIAVHDVGELAEGLKSHEVLSQHHARKIRVDQLTTQFCHLNCELQEWAFTAAKPH